MSIIEYEISQDEDNDSGHHEEDDIKEQVDIINENSLGDEMDMISVSNHNANILEANNGTHKINGTIQNLLMEGRNLLSHRTK